LAARQICHVPVAVSVAFTLIPAMVALHPEKVGGALRGVQIGSGAGGVQLLGEAGIVLRTTVEVHDAVTAPTLNDTLVDEIVTVVPAGLMQGPADATWAPKPSVAAIAGATR